VKLKIREVMRQREGMQMQKEGMKMQEARMKQ